MPIKARSPAPTRATAIVLTETFLDSVIVDTSIFKNVCLTRDRLLEGVHVAAYGVEHGPGDDKAIGSHTSRDFSGQKLGARIVDFIGRREPLGKALFTQPQVFLGKRKCRVGEAIGFSGLVAF